MRRVGTLVPSLAAMLAIGLLATASGHAAVKHHEARVGAAVAPAAEQGPGVLMGQTQKEHWESGTAQCPKADSGYCADEISQGQFVAWPFIAQHSGTVEAIFAALGTNSGNTGAEIGIYANRVYSYAEIVFDGEAGSSKETWTPAKFKEYEAEIPPEDPGKLLSTSGKVAESSIKNDAWTEFKLQDPVKVTKGQKYWLANTAFAPASSSELHRYQHFYHETLSTTEDQPWGDYSNEPTDWPSVVRPLGELPSPETTKINCEKCNTAGWLQEEPKGFKLVNSNREAQEEGGQTYSYAYGEIEEGSTAPTVVTGSASEVKETTATLGGTVNPNGVEVSECKLEYGITISYGSSTPCSSPPGSGISPVKVSASVTGLKANTTYHFRIYAKSSAGSSTGLDASFKTLPEAPTVATGAASGVTDAKATLNATVNPNGGEVSECKLEYGTSTSYESSAPCSTQPGSGTSPVGVAAATSALSASTEYHFRVSATNVGGTSVGSDGTFKTTAAPIAPTVVTGTATNVSQFGATLNATVNPNGVEVSECKLEYGTTISYGSSTPCSSPPGSGTSPVKVSAPATGLKANTTYHFRIYAKSAAGISTGLDANLKTLPEAPTVSTSPASEITQTKATLNATVNPNGGEVSECKLEYGTSTSYESSAPCSSLPGAGTSAVSVTAEALGLSLSTEYHFRVSATNAGGTNVGADESFKTAAAPVAPTTVTGSASEVTQTTATLSATVNPNGVEVSECKLEYGTTTSYGSSIACSSPPGSGTSPVKVSAPATGLKANTTYHFRIIAKSTAGTGTGLDASIKTLPEAPTVSTNAASEITQTGATLNGTVNPNGGEVSECKFEYGASTSYESSVPCSTLTGSGNSPVAVSAPGTGMLAGASYYFRVVASNAGGTSYGAVESLTTELPTVPTPQGPGAPPISPLQSISSTQVTAPEPEQKPPPAPAIAIVGRSLTATATGNVGVTLRCPVERTSCGGTITLETLARAVGDPAGKPKGSSSTLASGAFKIAEGHTTTIRLRLSARARKLIARARVLHARAAVVALNPAGLARTTQTLVTIRPARAHPQAASVRRHGTVDA